MKPPGLLKPQVSPSFHRAEAIFNINWNCPLTWLCFFYVLVADDQLPGGMDCCCIIRSSLLLNTPGTTSIHRALFKLCFLLSVLPAVEGQPRNGIRAGYFVFTFHPCSPYVMMAWHLLGSYKRCSSTNPVLAIDFIDKKSPYGAMKNDGRSRRPKNLRRPLGYSRSLEATTGH